MAQTDRDSQASSAAYDSFDDFLQTAIKDYSDRGWQRPNFVALLIASGLLALIALSRAGIRHFWAAHDRPTPQLRVLEGLPIAALLAACIGLTFAAAPAMRFTQATADALHAPGTYVRAILSAKPVPPPAPPAPAAQGEKP